MPSHNVVRSRVITRTKSDANANIDSLHTSDIDELVCQQDLPSDESDHVYSRVSVLSSCSALVIKARKQRKRERERVNENDEWLEDIARKTRSYVDARLR
jgi:hypothetical protein